LFTGLVEGIGTVVLRGSGLAVDTAGLDTVRGDSISVDGACLTVTAFSGGAASFDLSGETGRTTIAPGYTPGRKVNLERALPADGRFHGHFVTGHVDCTGIVEEVLPARGWTSVRISFPHEHSPLVVDKGSIAVNGISLTVAEAGSGVFSAALIPETLAATTAGEWAGGTRVNIEFDIIGKYLQRQTVLASRDARLREYLDRQRDSRRG